MRRVYILPNLFTAGSLFCGLLAIFEVLESSSPASVVYACELILLAGLLDLLDGVVARLTRSESSFGLNFDSLSDVVAFGAAPAVVLYSTVAGSYPLLAKATCGLYVVCGAMRLGRFNVQASREEKRAFLGLPIPAAAYALVSLFWALSTRPGLAGWVPPEKVLPPVLVLLAYLMVSKFRYYGMKSFRLSKRQPFEILVSIVVVLSLLLAVKQHIDLIILILFGLYALSGPAVYLRSRRLASGPLSPGDGETQEGGAEMAPRPPASS